MFQNGSLLGPRGPALAGRITCVYRAHACTRHAPHAKERVSGSSPRPRKHTEASATEPAEPAATREPTCSVVDAICAAPPTGSTRSVHVNASAQTPDQTPAGKGWWSRSGRAFRTLPLGAGGGAEHQGALVHAESQVVSLRRLTKPERRRNSSWHSCASEHFRAG